MEALLTISEPQQSYTRTIFTSSDDQDFPRMFMWRINYIAPNSTVFPDLSSFPRESIELIQKINSFITLNNNWDSYGAGAPSVISIRNARRFIIRNALVSLPLYFVSPGVNGEIMIECKKGSKAAEIYFNPDESDELLLFDDNQCIFEGSLNDSFTFLISFFND
jgi:hypothetical protein